MPLSPLQIFTFIAGCAFVIFAAYFTTYLVARGSQRAYKGRAVRVIDRFSLSKDKSVAVISVYEKIYIVAFSHGAATLLDVLEKQDIPAENLLEGPGPPMNFPSFEAILKKIQGKEERRK